MALALLGALSIGLTLGLLGFGGSILTVPLLVFILDRPEKIAVAESLAIVGLVAIAGVIPYALRRQIDWKSVLFFGIPGMLGASLGACGSYFISGSVHLTLFSIAMVAAAVMMLMNPSSEIQRLSYVPSKRRMITKGFFIGGLTGLIGVGGGFLIVPALVILCNLPVHYAVGTSLVIIAMNSLIGFVNQLIALHFLDLHVSWSIIVIISITGILGCLGGILLSKRITQTGLKKIMGCSILALGAYILFIKVF